MVLKEQIEQALGEVLIPAVGLSVVRLNMVRGVEVTNKMVKVILASTALSQESQEWIKARTVRVVKKLPDVDEVELEFVECKPSELNQFGHVIAVMSGKGGVGKSLVTSLLAVALNRRGYTVGILDADLTGPTIPRMFGISTRPSGSNTGILPVLSKSGIEVMSLNLLLPEEDEAVIWRGPIISSTIAQFWEGVVWGKCDYLIVDLPPGTADAPLTVIQRLPLSGVVIVFTPQDLTAMIVRKALKMVQSMDKTVLGVVENMSYLYIPEIDKKIEIFGRSNGEEMARVANAPLLGQLPIDPQLARLCDEGNIEIYDSEVVNSLGQALLKVMPEAKQGK